MMAARHGTRRRYTDGCRCDDCKDAQRIYQRRYRERSLSGEQIIHHAMVRNLPTGPGPVEIGVMNEIRSATEDRHGLAQMALALAHILDNQNAVSQAPDAAKVLASLLDKLHQAGASGSRGHHAAVRTMTKKGGV